MTHDTRQLSADQPDPQAQGEGPSGGSPNESFFLQEQAGGPANGPLVSPPPPQGNGEGQPNGSSIAAPPPRASLRYRLLGRAGSVAIALCEGGKSVAVVKGNLLSSTGRFRLWDDIIEHCKCLGLDLTDIEVRDWLHDAACEIFDAEAVGEGAAV